ncbi:MAG: hypothetical protein LBJ19_02545 [Holosporaceae bacterium]|jgi:IS1 family transposase|nr:hypothetical protein [Holosporaceae bacterium]
MLIISLVDRNRLRFAGFEVGDSSSDTFRRLWDKLKAQTLNFVCTDGNPVYTEVLGEDADLKHVVTKSETCLVESYNSVLRYYLARLHRKTKCYSKSEKMLRLSICLFLHKKYNLYS